MASDLTVIQIFGHAAPGLRLATFVDASEFNDVFDRPQHLVTVHFMDIDGATDFRNHSESQTAA